jgi:DNA-nicking Smr family endonuclease
MKYEVGDEIIVLHSNEEGRVIEIMNEKMVMIEVRGVKFPAYTDQIDFPYFKRFTEKKLFPEPKKKVYIDEVPREKIKTKAPREATGIWLSFLPVFATDEFGDDFVTHLKIHLQNNSADDLRFVYRLTQKGDTDFELQNQVLAFHDFYLHDVPFDWMNDSPLFSFEFSLVKEQITKAPFFEATQKIKPKQLFEKIEQLKQQGEAFFKFLLLEKYPDRTALNDWPSANEQNSSKQNKRGGANVQPKEESYFTGGTIDLSGLSKSGFKVYAKKNKSFSVQSTIDLHIDKLRDDWEKMDKADILLFQLAELEKHMDLAHAQGLPQLTVIHGVGTGRLKEEVHEMLKHKKEVKHYVHQYHPWYGFGATEIHFKYP